MAGAEPLAVVGAEPPAVAGADAGAEAAMAAAPATAALQLCGQSCLLPPPSGCGAWLQATGPVASMLLPVSALWLEA